MIGGFSKEELALMRDQKFTEALCYGDGWQVVTDGIAARFVGNWHELTATQRDDARTKITALGMIGVGIMSILEPPVFMEYGDFGGA
jgi:hypothetical protein